jgi:hypothetical protein
MRLLTQFLFAVAIAAALCTNDVKENSPIDIEVFSNPQMTFRYIDLGLGANVQKSPANASFALNLGKKNVIVGSKEKASWGISCDGSADNSCHITSNDKYEISYFSKKFYAQHAELYLRPIKDISVNVDQPKVDKIPVDLVVGGDSWIIKDLGILGLSPSGVFSKYLTQLYGPKADVVFKFKLENDTVPNDDLVYHLMAYINPVYKSTDVIKEFPLSENSENWSLNANIDFISPAWSFKNKKACFNTDDLLIQVEDSTPRCNAVKSLVCNGKIGPDCVRSIADLNKAPKLVIDLEGTKFEFTPQEYLYYEKDVVQCRFGDIGGLRNNGACSGDTVLGIGKFFLRKHIPVFKFRYGAKSSIVLLNNYNAPDDLLFSNGFNWPIVGGIAAVVAIAAIIFVVLRKKPVSDQEYYASCQNEA